MYLQQKGIGIQDLQSLYFKVKSRNEPFMDLHVVDGSSDSTYVVHLYFGTPVQNTWESVIDNECPPDWSSHYDCDCYVSFCVSWINGIVEAGKGTCIGYDKTSYRSSDIIDVDDISIMSDTTAHWVFDIPKSTTSGKVLGSFIFYFFI